MALSGASGLGGCYLTAETGTDNANGSGTCKWQLRDGAGRALARRATVTTWYMEDATDMTPHLATAGFGTSDADDKKEDVDANQELIVQTAEDGILSIVINDGKDGALYAYAHLGNGNGDIATVTVTGT